MGVVRLSGQAAFVVRAFRALVSCLGGEEPLEQVLVLLC